MRDRDIRDGERASMTTSKDQLTKTSKFLSLVLRHRPGLVGMQLDSEGWLPIDDLIENANRQGKQLTLELIHEVVARATRSDTRSVTTDSDSSEPRTFRR